jgi:hypothetical protein
VGNQGDGIITLIWKNWSLGFELKTDSGLYVMASFDRCVENIWVLLSVHDAQ